MTIHDCDRDGHVWGDVIRSHFAGNPHRRCVYCTVVTLDLSDEEE